MFGTFLLALLADQDIYLAAMTTTHTAGVMSLIIHPLKYIKMPKFVLLPLLIYVMGNYSKTYCNFLSLTVEWQCSSLSNYFTQRSAET